MTLRPTFRSALRSATIRLGLPLLTATGGGTDHGLYLDGRLRVVGEPFEGARLVVYRDDKAMQVMTNDLERIELRLDLQRTYRLSFEHPGCITKQLFFDTRVPDEDLDGAPFTFFFKVTLEQLTAEGSTLRYAGPVGSVRYYPELGDFDYDRDYRMLRDEALAEAAVFDPDTLPLEAKEVAMPDGAYRPVDPAPIEAMSTPVMEARMSEEASPASEAMPAKRDRRMVAAFVDPTLALGELAGKARAQGLNAAPTVRVRTRGEGHAVHAHHAAAGSMPVAAALPAARQPDGREEEVIVEKLRVTRIVRITSQGHTTEYRHVTHRYGMNFYFKDGISCSAHTHARGSRER